MNARSSAWASAWSLAIVLVYLLMVVNFQSWLDPLIILTALPGALAGIVWMLFVTGTTLQRAGADGRDHEHRRGHRQQHPVVTFANDQRRDGDDARRAALAAGVTRLRPVLMTALAMIIGMLPMALGLGEGGEQNAPLGRAVIGGLTLATVTTLFFVPVVYRAWRSAPHGPRPSKEPTHDDPHLMSTSRTMPASQGEGESFDPEEHRPSRGRGPALAPWRRRAAGRAALAGASRASLTGPLAEQQRAAASAIPSRPRRPRGAQ